MTLDANLIAGKRVVFVINSLSGGGAEKVLCELLKQLETFFVDSKVTLVLLDQLEERYSVPAYVNRITLDCRGSMVISMFALHRTLSSLKPDVVLSFLTRANCAAVFSAAFLRFTCLISERVNTSSHFGHGLKSAVNKRIVRFFYPRADRVLVVSKGVGADLVQNFAVPADRIEVIYNPYDLARLAALAAEPPALTVEGEYAVSVGRLVPNKNFGLLIRAWHDAKPAEKLVILGEGPEHDNLQRLIDELNLHERVILGGFQRNPHAIMQRARYAVFSSLAEGFPNALAEAMALSLPVIASDCDSGPAEILHDEIRVHPRAAFRAKYGILVAVDDKASMVEALHLFQDVALRDHYRQMSRERIVDFGMERSISRYAQALQQTN